MHFFDEYIVILKLNYPVLYLHVMKRERENKEKRKLKQSPNLVDRKGMVFGMH